MTTAARLLRESDAPLGEVSTRIGYTSEFAFANAFKREYGTAPGNQSPMSRRVLPLISALILPGELPRKSDPILPGGR
jgi:AraC-like DNA-binding protein